MAILSEMFKQTAQQLAEQNTASQLIDEIEDLLEQFRERPLPQTRREFEKTVRNCIKLITRFETICTTESRFLPNVRRSLFQEGRRKE